VEIFITGTGGVIYFHLARRFWRARPVSSGVREIAVQPLANASLKSQ
jgi:hypothetical protein